MKHVNDVDTWEYQKTLLENSIQHLNIAAGFLRLAWEPAKIQSSAALSADIEPEQVETLIKDIKQQVATLGTDWEIHHSVNDN